MATYIIGTLIFLAFCYAIYRTFSPRGNRAAAVAPAAAGQRLPPLTGKPATSIRAIAVTITATINSL